MATVRTGDKWGYVDSTGKFVIEPSFDNAEPFGEGVAAVMVADVWGCIDKRGRFVANPQFKSVGFASDGRSLVETTSGLFGFLGW